MCKRPGQSSPAITARISSHALSADEEAAAGVWAGWKRAELKANAIRLEAEKSRMAAGKTGIRSYWTDSKKGAMVALRGFEPLFKP